MAFAEIPAGTKGFPAPSRRKRRCSGNIVLSVLKGIGCGRDITDSG